ncbi:MAG: ADP-dependent glucokinase/phosphofructokinase [Candidatus Micrarchaeia archaeon]|jgi:ADP-dependent phosphofructokinase/glucokinase
MARGISIEDEWNARLVLARKATLKGKRLFCAFNIVVDLVKFVSAKEISQKAALAGNAGALEILRKSKTAPATVQNSSDFLSAMVFHMREGKSAHFVCENQHLFQWISKEFGKPDQTRLGGQAGIIANQAALLGAKAIIYSPFFSDEHAKLFDENVFVPVCKNGGTTLVPARNAGKPESPTKRNWIFEYKQGDEVEFAGEKFSIPRSNRFILASPMPMAPAFCECARASLPQIGKGVGAAFFAGFHYLQPRYGKVSFEKILGQQDKDVSALRKRNRGLLVHVEYVPMEHKEIERAVLRHIAREVDSLGINEVEIAEALEKLGFAKEARAVRAGESAATLFLGAQKLLSALKLKRLHLHNLGYQMVLLKKPLHSSPEKVRNGLLFSSLCASAKALLGREFKKSELSKAYKFPLSSRGFAQMELLAYFLQQKFPRFGREKFLADGVFDAGKFVLVVSPTQVVENPKSTVGIGDVVSSSSLLAEL